MCYYVQCRHHDATEEHPTLCVVDAVGGNMRIYYLGAFLCFARTGGEFLIQKFQCQVGSCYEVRGQLDPLCTSNRPTEECCILGNFAKWDSQKQADCQCEDGVTLEMNGETAEDQNGVCFEGEKSVMDLKGNRTEGANPANLTQGNNGSMNKPLGFGVIFFITSLATVIMDTL
ncbi:hypothetical protein AGOR_G00165080 [Albula goreensis]|uniref:Uncharacterized protein n=1 Tax=Albula goreensis TaxID=1534307 RepID=A0A8T3D4C2_9TELE|nr:hypothetical protein AGOR_G00165080 [Albula goreensis]